MGFTGVNKSHFTTYIGGQKLRSYKWSEITPIFMAENKWVSPGLFHPKGLFHLPLLGSKKYRRVQAVDLAKSFGCLASLPRMMNYVIFLRFVSGDFLMDCSMGLTISKSKL